MVKAFKSAALAMAPALFPAVALAHGEESGAASSFGNQLAALSLRVALYGGAFLLLLSLFALLKKKRGKSLDRALFGSIVAVTVAVSLFLAGSTVYLNTISYTKGPVHWHADFKLFVCGEEINLRDPRGFLSNKIGSPTVHEHNDARIHIEGVLMEPAEASLGNFFAQVGGDLHGDHLAIPTNDGQVSVTNGELCGGEPAEVQVFVHQVKDRKHLVTKLDETESHVIAPFSAVPPGDCVIIEFDRPKDTTEHTCISYEAAKERGKLE